MRSRFLIYLFTLLLVSGCSDVNQRVNEYVDAVAQEIKQTKGFGQGLQSQLQGMGQQGVQKIDDKIRAFKVGLEQSRQRLRAMNPPKPARKLAALMDRSYQRWGHACDYTLEAYNLGQKIQEQARSTKTPQGLDELRTNLRKMQAVSSDLRTASWEALDFAKQAEEEMESLRKQFPKK